MTTFNYTDKTIDIPESLGLALEDEGVSDAIYTIFPNGNLTIDTSTGVQVDVDNAVDNAVTGTLFSNKEARAEEVENKTRELVGIGVEAWISGKIVFLSKKIANGYYEDYEYLLDNPTSLSASKPYVVETIDGETLTTSNIADILTLANNAADRWIYLNSSTTNGDGSKGESHIIEDIRTAVNQTALNAITDTRA
jgi:hypothetical protein